MNIFKRIFMVTLILFSMNLFVCTAQAEGGTGTDGGDQPVNVCGTISLGKTEVFASDTEYYSLTVEESGWYYFDSCYLGGNRVIIRDFIEVSEAGEKHYEIIDETYAYLTAGFQYYARFCVVSVMYEDYDHEGYDYYYVDITEHLLELSKYTGAAITGIEVDPNKLSSVAYRDDAYFESANATISFADSTTDWSTFYYSNPLKLNSGFCVYFYMDNENYSTKDTQYVPAGTYTVHVQLYTSEEYEATYSFKVVDYQEMNYPTLSEGANENVKICEDYLFTPEKSGEYAFYMADADCMEFNIQNAETNEKPSYVTGNYSEYSVYQLNGGTTYILSLECFGGDRTLIIRKRETPVSASGSLKLKNCYLAGAYDTLDYSVELKYANGETTKITQSDSFDKYFNTLKIEVLDGETLLYSNNEGKIQKANVGTYRIKASVGNLLVQETQIHYGSVTEYAKTLPQLKLGEKVSVKEGQMYGFVAPEDNFYDYSGCLSKVGKENDDGSVKWESADLDSYDHYDDLKAGKSYILIFYKSGENEITIRHDYENNICTICGRYETVDTPKLQSVENTATGAKVTWNKVANTKYYRVYRKTGTGSWTRLTETSSTSYVDTEAPVGQTCYYTVRCLSYDKKQFISDFNRTGLANVYYNSPEITLSNGASGISIKWKQVNGAAGYIVYRKTEGGSYARIANITSGSTLSYKDTTPSAGVTYIYAVRAYKGDYRSWYIPETIIRLTEISPTAASKTTGVTVTWSKIKGADGYYVYRKTGTGSYSRIATVSGASYTDTSAKSGTTYTYTVRGYNGSYLSPYVGTTVKFLSAIKPTLSNTTSGIKVTWTKVTGATGYAVYRKTGSQSYTRIKTITSGSTISYTDTAVKTKKGTTYTYAVRAISTSGGTTYMGWYTGVSLTRK